MASNAHASFQRRVEGHPQSSRAGDRDAPRSPFGRAPLRVRADDLRHIGAADELPLTNEYRATRGIMRVRESVQAMTPKDWRAVSSEYQGAAHA
jgi:hypothetical protein